MTLPAHYVIDRLIYGCYAHNRTVSPEKSLDFWRGGFDKVDEMEILYQREREAA